MATPNSIEKLSVIVPKNPFVKSSLRDVQHCLAALDVEKLMLWWPGDPHNPERDAQTVRNIQRSLDWKRVAQIAAYLLQREIKDVPDRLDQYFGKIYEPKKLEPGRQWPPKVARIIGFERSEFPTFSNVLLHVNGAEIQPKNASPDQSARLVFDAKDKNLRFSVVDGQHRINGAYFAIRLLQETKPNEKWEVPSEVFLDLDTQPLVHWTRNCSRSESNKSQRLFAMRRRFLGSKNSRIWSMFS